MLVVRCLSVVVRWLLCVVDSVADVDCLLRCVHCMLLLCVVSFALCCLIVVVC